MLSADLIRTRIVKHKILPLYIDPEERHWQEIAGQLLSIFRLLPGQTREEMEEEISETVGDQPAQIVEQGLAKLLEDRCEFEVVSDLPPSEVREKVFAIAATHRQRDGVFDRDIVLKEVAAELKIDPAQVEQALFADLKPAQRITKFEDISSEQLLNRYNVAAAQAMLFRATGVTVQIYGETPARFRQLFRMMKFHRLIADIESIGDDAYTLKIDGPLSLFSSTQKYGCQLAFFLPWILLCKKFELTARIRWGTKKLEKTFALNDGHALRSHIVDNANWLPKELEMFAESFRGKKRDWELLVEANPVRLSDRFWVPDFLMRHRTSGREVGIEMPGFWRRTHIDSLLARLKAEIPGQFVIAISEQNLVDETDDATERAGIYRYKRTPLPDEVIRIAEAQGPSLFTPAVVPTPPVKKPRKKKSDPAQESES